MIAEVFVDTNVLLYSIDDDPLSAKKRQRAQQLLLTERWCWSVQVAAEFFVNATSPKRPFRLAAVDALALVETWFNFPTLELSPSLFSAAVVIHQTFQLSYWDAAIIAAAMQSGCSRVYSEDMNAGQNYNGVIVVNPFAGLTP